MSASIGFSVPLIGNPTAAFKRYNLLTKAIRVIKPERILGAVWTSNKVSMRRPVVMCPACVRKYRGWWKREHYRPDWGWAFRADCDGCSTPFVVCTLFHAEEKFYGTLAPNHGLNPQP